MIEIDGKYSSAKVFHTEIDPESMAQIVKMVNSPAIMNPVRIMPDFHAGNGAVIGFTMKAGDVIIPNIVGVDIGCGMLTALISNTSMSVEDMDKTIRSAIPMGFNTHQSPKYTNMGDVDMFMPIAKLIDMDKSRLLNSIGTLGGGNHFIEVGAGSSGGTYITIHSGSRNFGKVLAEYYQKIAKEYSGGKQDVIKDMEYLPTDEYLGGMMIAQKYAALNRSVMMTLILDALGVYASALVESVHNYVSLEDGIIRKGAVSAREGDVIILPFNRAEGIWVMMGKGNSDWNYSAPHGAGRKMSRSQAKKTMTQEYVDSEMASTGVFSSFNPVDEAPGAYKTPEEIQNNIGDTATKLYSIKPILNIKA